MDDENKIATRKWIQDTFKVYNYNNPTTISYDRSKCLTGQEIKSLYLDLIKINGTYVANKLYKRSALSINPNPTPITITLWWDNASGENYESISIIRWSKNTGTVEEVLSVNPTDRATVNPLTYTGTAQLKDESNGDVWYMGVKVNKSEGLGTGYDGDDGIYVTIRGFSLLTPHLGAGNFNAFKVLQGNMKNPENGATTWKCDNVMYNEWLGLKSPSVSISISD